MTKQPDNTHRAVLEPDLGSPLTSILSLEGEEDALAPGEGAELT